MKIEINSDSPILLKLVPKTPLESFENGAISRKLRNMGITHCVDKRGSLVFNIDNNWKDFDDRAARENPDAEIVDMFDSQGMSFSN